MKAQSPERLSRHADIIQVGKVGLQKRVQERYTPELAEAQLDYYVALIPALLSSDLMLPGAAVEALINRYLDAQDSEGNLPAYTQGLLTLIINLVQGYFGSTQEDIVRIKPQIPFFGPQANEERHLPSAPPVFSTGRRRLHPLAS